MRISSINFYPSLSQYKFANANPVKPLSSDYVTFGGEQRHSRKYYNAKKYANFMMIINYFKQSDISTYNLDKLEGIQEDLPSFKDLSMKDIVFICRDTNALSLVRGCSNKCLHCYVGAEPSSDKSTQYINRLPYEDFDVLMKDFKALKDRMGVTPFSYGIHSPYLTSFFDSDGMNIVLYDKKGGVHDFTEINDRMYEATNIKHVFDTGGWNPKDERMQMRAKKYVKYFLEPDNESKMYQINLSINPFNPIYVKSREYGYNPLEYKPSVEELDNVYNGATPGEKLYKIYINRMANMLYTFSPLIPLSHFGVISRTPADDDMNMDFFTQEEHQVNKMNILKNLKMRYVHDLNSGKEIVKNKRELNKYLTYYVKLFNKPDNKGLIATAKYRNLYEQRNPQLKDKDYENKFAPLKKSNQIYNNIKNLLTGKTVPITSDVNSVVADNIKHSYYKIIDTDGKVYLFDNYRMLPTELQLNLSTNDKQTPKFNVKTEDFVITKEITRESI